MIHATSLLSLALVAAPITIGDVTSTREAGRLVVDISADGMVDPEVASAKISDGRIYLFVGDTRVKADNRAWGEGAAQIRAHRHRREVELVVPMGEDGNCQGPVEFSKAAGGLRALIGCEGAGAVKGTSFGASRAARVRAATAAASVEMPAPSRPVAQVEPLPPPDKVANKIENERDSKELRAVLGLPKGAGVVDEADGDDLPTAAIRTAPSSTPTPPALVAVPVTDKAAPATALAGAAAPGPSPTVSATGLAQTATQPESAAIKPSSGGTGVGAYLAGLLLVALGGAAAYFARKRAVTPRYVRIVETASLGPKRAIVVAEIGGERVILGTSEAGITVLQGRTESFGVMAPAAAMAASVAAPAAAPAAYVDRDVLAFEDEASGDRARAELPMDEALADIPEPDVEDLPMIPAQGGLLARLFRRGKPANEAEVHDFDELLEDSVEDQELRHKLSLGMAGRVP